MTRPQKPIRGVATQSIALGLMLLGAICFGTAAWMYLEPLLPAAPANPALAADALPATPHFLPDNSGPVVMVPPNTPSPTQPPAAAEPQAPSSLRDTADTESSSPPNHEVAPERSATQPLENLDAPGSRDLARPPTPVPLVPPSRLVMPSIGVDSKVIPVGWREVTSNGTVHYEGKVADFAAGWHNNSAMPDASGNVVVSGHNNIRGMVFRRLADLVEGDRITLYAGDRAFVYDVVERFIVREAGQPLEVREANARWIGPFADSRLTLVSCWPFTGNSHRVIVIARAE